MSQYRYLKLRNGEDIVAMTVVNDTNGTVEMTLPCNIALTPSMIGKGTVIKLSPLVPFTKDNRVVIAANEVVYTTTIDDKFIQFYDKACKDWIHLRDEIGLNVKDASKEKEYLKRFRYEFFSINVGSANFKGAGTSIKKTSTNVQRQGTAYRIYGCGYLMPSGTDLDDYENPEILIPLESLVILSS